MTPALLAAAVALIAGAAQADPLREAAYRDQATAAAAFAPPSQGISAPLPAGIARTSIDHRFERQGLDGSLGFLCGLQPPAAATGAAAATGVDPHGRFLGVKLHMSFR